MTGEFPKTGDWEMACPRDGAKLAKTPLKEATVDVCPRCAGTWFDATELGRVAHAKEVEEVATFVPDDAGGSRFQCPRCAGDCYRTKAGGVELDACTSCRGVWLDAGELDAAKRAPPTAARPAGFKGFIARWRD